MGGAFGMGAVGGGIWHMLKGMKNSPSGHRFRGGIDVSEAASGLDAALRGLLAQTLDAPGMPPGAAAPGAARARQTRHTRPPPLPSAPGPQAIRREAPRTGGSFAVWGGLFSTFDCTLVALRKKEDPWNSIAAGALTGARAQRSSSAKLPARGCPARSSEVVLRLARCRQGAPASRVCRSAWAVLLPAPHPSTNTLPTPGSPSTPTAGGFLQLRTGLKSAGKSAVFGGVLLAMIEGVGILLTRVTAPPPAPGAPRRRRPRAAVGPGDARAPGQQAPSGTLAARCEHRRCWLACMCTL